MGEHERRQADLFEEYRRALVTDPAAYPPRDLQPEDAWMVRLLEGELGGARHETPPPNPDFTTALRERLEREAELLRAPAEGGADNHEHVARTDRTRRRKPLWLRAAAAVLIVVVGGLIWQISGSERQSEPGQDRLGAKEIVLRAERSTSSPDLAGVDSFRMEQLNTSTIPDSAGGGKYRAETTHWYEAPDRWRVETEEETTISGVTTESRSGAVSNGEKLWRWDGDSVRVRELRPEDRQNAGGVPVFGSGDLQAMLEALSKCGTPEHRGEETVAGREAYVISFPQSECPSASIPSINGRSMLWIDKETFFVLKMVQYDWREGREDRVLSMTRVTSVKYNIELDRDLFTYEPSPGATVRDESQGQAPENPRDKLQPPRINEEPSQKPPPVDFPVLRPGWLPEGVTVEDERRTGAEEETVVVLSFDHRPQDDGHLVLTLAESEAGAQAGGISSEASASTEQIGGRDVKVVRRGEACITMGWEQDGASLILTNAYDPPGQILYSCATLRRIVESVGE